MKKKKETKNKKEKIQESPLEIAKRIKKENEERCSYLTLSIEDLEEENAKLRHIISIMISVLDN
jgi:hypothetical protein